MPAGSGGKSRKSGAQGKAARTRPEAERRVVRAGAGFGCGGKMEVGGVGTRGKMVY